MRPKKLPFLIVPLCLAAGMPAWAQGPLNPPSPLVAAEVQAARSPGSSTVSWEAAQRAQELGFASLAASMYRQLLASPQTDQTAATLALVSALLDEGQTAEADKTLQAFTGPRGSAWHLRAGLVAIMSKRLDAARAELAAIKPGELSSADAAWADFLQGAIFDLQVPQDTTKANEFYLKAENSAPNAVARARFKLSGEEVRLLINPPSDAAVRQSRLNYEANRGRPFGFDMAKIHAQSLYQRGEVPAATAFLQEVLRSLLPQERAHGDKLGLLLGMIADKGGGGPGRLALNRLLETGTDPLLQNVALQVLALASTDDVLRGMFRAELNKLIDAPVKHPILESLLLIRAQVGLTDKDYAQAEKDARRLLEQYPGSLYRVHAYGVLTASSWEQRRYRAAADNARKARAELPADAARARGELVVLEAEAWYRAGRAGDPGDFRSAADAYAAALKERPANIKPGDLMFQRVLSEIKAGALDTAPALLDELARDPAFDLENRWRAEWNLARALQLRGPEGVRQAYARVNALLGEKVSETAVPAPALPADLRARMAWLQGRLALDAGEAERAVKLADELAATAAGVPDALRIEILSTSQLTKAEAYFSLGREAEALKTLQQLREDPRLAKSDGAVQSYLLEAGHYAAQEKTVDAQKLFTRLAEDFPLSEDAPNALFQAALLAEHRGQEANYKEANRLIEDLVRRFPKSDLVVDARLKQGDLLRNLNELPAAQHAYEALLASPLPRETQVIVQLALADCHTAMSASDASHFNNAQSLYEHLRDRADASADVRVEAGFKLGELWVRRDDRAKAVEVWWDLVNNFLLNPAVEPQLRGGRFWVGRALYRSGEIYELMGKIENAKQAWIYLRDWKLPNSEALARAKLARFGLPEVAP